VGVPKSAEKAAAELFRVLPDAKTTLIAQTTISAHEYAAIAQSLRLYFPNIEIADTICGATAQRQEALRELCAQVDAVIVVGGKESANTRRLFSFAQALGKPAYIVQAVDEITPELAVAISEHEAVGICAGASTSEDLVDEIETALRSLSK
jgi:4-hydroxy-3-methylbut-2-enyl diphosphate reductase